MVKRTHLPLRGTVCLVVVLALAGTGFAAEATGDELIQLVINLLKDKDEDMRCLGLDQVRTEAKGQAATKRFAAELPKLPRTTQLGLLSALADRGDPAARPAVVDLLTTSGEESVRVAAIGALGFLGGPADARLLLELLQTGSQAEQAAARTSLVRVRGESVPAAIAAALQQAPPPVRVTLIEILASRRARHTPPALLAAALDADPAVRTAAMIALGKLAGPAQIPAMVQGVLKAAPGRERVAAEKAVMSTCARIGDAPKRAAPVLAAMRTLDTAGRTAMLPTLGRIGGPAARKLVEAAIANSDPAVHETGLRALCNWPDASVADRLIELATTDRHPAHRTMALRALIRIAPLRDNRSDDDRLKLLKKSMAMCARDAERNLALQRARAIRTVQTLRFVAPYMGQPAYAQQACATVVELAHHRGLREPNKAEFDRALDKVIATSKNPTVVDRAQRYKKGQTWARPVR